VPSQQRFIVLMSTLNRLIKGTLEMADRTTMKFRHMHTYWAETCMHLHAGRLNHH
jgi:hypothetical protein